MHDEVKKITINRSRGRICGHYEHDDEYYDNLECSMTIRFIGHFKIDGQKKNDGNQYVCSDEVFSDIELTPQEEKVIKNLWDRIEKNVKFHPQKGL